MLHQILHTLEHNKLDLRVKLHVPFQTSPVDLVTCDTKAQVSKDGA